MIRLLRENIARVLKSATFWIFFGAYVLYSILTPIIIRFFPYDPIYHSSMQLLTLCYGVIGIPVPAACVAFICTVVFGSDFLNGTLKNKIIVGHKKSQIYAANLLTTSLIAIALQIVYLLFFCVITLPLFGKITAPAKNVILLLTDGTLMILAYSSIFTFITMTSKNALVAMLVSLALIIASYFVTLFVSDAIMNIPTYIEVDAEFWGIPYKKQVPNPDYPSKIEWGLYNFMMDFLPTGQNVRINYLNEYRWQPTLYSLGWIGATSCVGILIFNKSNIK